MKLKTTTSPTGSFTPGAGDLAADAYTFGYPLVLMDAMRAIATATPRASTHRAPINQFAHARELPDATAADIVSATTDTLSSVAWLDVSKEPIILSVPDMGTRYYLMPLLDAWTNVFASVGTRTTGNRQGDFAITAPRWSGILPDGVKEIKAPTNIVWLNGRTHAKGKADCDAVRAIQDEYRLTPLSAWGTPYTQHDDASVYSTIEERSLASEQVDAMDPEAFFARLNTLMIANPPNANDALAITRFAAIGVGPGKALDVHAAGLRPGVETARRKLAMAAEKPYGTPVNGWDVLANGVGNYGTNYALRAAVAAGALGANLPADAIHPMSRMDAHARPLTGANRYFLRFTRGKLPPTNAFWSLTMYNEQGALVANPLDRCALHSHDELAIGEDGSLTLFIQNESPGADKESNWLPAPSGLFHVALRLFWPKKEAIDGTWRPPAIERGSNSLA
ncbi:MAG TPA: DUF1254 domain-containing protein [Gemmatimonadaceae bacterium]